MEELNLKIEQYEGPLDLLLALARTQKVDLAKVSILALAGTIGIETIGEGVETARQRDVLRRLGCLYGQGFLYGSPQPFDAIGS